MTPIEHDRLIQNLVTSLKARCAKMASQGGATKATDSANDASLDQKDDNRNDEHDDIRIIRTHISSVILSGHVAYKLKRPVRFPFLDFSTVEKRHAHCVREIEVNRRTAPEIYQAVVPITGSVNHPDLGGSGTAIDWAIRMRRFESGKLFSELACKRELTQENIRDLAQRIARFHLEQTPVAPSAAERNKPTQQWLMESLDEIEQAIDGHVLTQPVSYIRPDAFAQVPGEELPEQPPADSTLAVKAQIEALRGLTTTTWDSSASFRAERLRQGWTRECHGDLHLKNITLIDNKPVIFDAIEFDDKLRMIDVVNEVAFTFMDLHAHNMPELAWQFLNEYQQQVGDYAGLKLLQYFTRYRAIIRAKVSLLSAEANSDANADATLPWQSDRFTRYWALALRPPGGPIPPKLFLVAGLSGSGKSTVANILSQKAGAVWLRADSERRRLFANSTPDERYGTQASVRTYRYLAEQARDLLGAGFSVVIDATFLNPQYIDLFDQVCKDLGKQFRDLESDMNADEDEPEIQSSSTPEMIFIVCEAEPEIMAQRIRQRQQEGNDPSEATVEVLNRQRTAMTIFSRDLPANAIFIKNNTSIKFLKSQIVEILKQKII